MLKILHGVNGYDSPWVWSGRINSTCILIDLSSNLKYVSAADLQTEAQYSNKGIRNEEK